MLAEFNDNFFKKNSVKIQFYTFSYKWVNKQKLMIIDLADDLKYGQRHVEKRKEIYAHEKIPFNITEIVEN